MAPRVWNLGFTSIQIPSETGSGLLTLRVDAQKNSMMRLFSFDHIYINCRFPIMEELVNSILPTTWNRGGGGGGALATCIYILTACRQEASK